MVLSIIVFLGALGMVTVEIKRGATASSNGSISVTYRPQETGYYCGPAVVQMALGYVTAAVPTQDQLAQEMQTDPVEGVTYTDMMSSPFESRGLPEVYEDWLELDDLKANNNDGYLTIILIYFGESYEYQHYVLVTGYNDSGIYVNDPWPTAWDQPEGRTTGAEAFISDELLTNLWGCDPSHWGLVIPYSKGSRPPPEFWQQYWYLFIIAFIAVAGIFAAMRVRRARKPKENLSSTPFL